PHWGQSRHQGDYRRRKATFQFRRSASRSRHCRGAHHGSSRPAISRNISQFGFSTAAMPNTRAAAPNATAAAATANEETFATVACRAHNRRKLLPLPPPTKPQPPLTRQQYDAK
ncbi:hypothetical protein HDU84_000917, partial [Entophlyctis sp. JEL0112]